MSQTSDRVFSVFFIMVLMVILMWVVGFVTGDFIARRTYQTCAANLVVATDTTFFMERNPRCQFLLPLLEKKDQPNG